jgi:hydroxymethylglutaryl-CoA lyase
MRDAPDVHVCEMSPRDGLHSLDIFVPTETKCPLIDANMACAFEHRHTTIGALVSDVKGTERALAAGVDANYFVISASQKRNRANVRRSIDKQLDGFRPAHAAEAGIPKALRRVA